MPFIRSALARGRCHSGYFHGPGVKTSREENRAVESDGLILDGALEAKIRGVGGSRRRTVDGMDHVAIKVVSATNVQFASHFN